MALFFDARWFDAKLAERGLTRDALAAAAGMDADALALAFKDQREIAPHEAQAFAAVLGEPVEDVARRCGVSTRAPRPQSAGEALDARLTALEGRLTRIEGKLDALLAALRP